MDRITGRLVSAETITGTLTVPTLPAPYEGSYSVTPSASEQTLPTADRLLSADVTIGAIPSEFVDVSDTTATPSTVKAGEIFHTADGARAVGEMVAVTNMVVGSFHTEAGKNYAHIVDVPYDGDGFPILIMVMVHDGLANPTSPIYSMSNQGTLWFYATRKNPTEGSTYVYNSENQKSLAVEIHRSSPSTPTQLTIVNQINSHTFVDQAPRLRDFATTLRMRSDTRFETWVDANGSCYLPDTDYDYVIVYSE